MSTQTIPSLDGVAGRVIRPDDAEYDKARTPFYGGVDPRPAAIVRVADANDVSRVIALVRETETEFVVRSGGHGVAGYAMPDGGIVLDHQKIRYDRQLIFGKPIRFADIDEPLCYVLAPRHRGAADRGR